MDEYGESDNADFPDFDNDAQPMVGIPFGSPAQEVISKVYYQGMN